MLDDHDAPATTDADHDEPDEDDPEDDADDAAADGCAVSLLEVMDSGFASNDLKVFGPSCYEMRCLLKVSLNREVPEHSTLYHCFVNLVSDTVRRYEGW